MVRVVSVLLRVFDFFQIQLVFILRPARAPACPTRNVQKLVPPLGTLRIRFPAFTYAGWNHAEFITWLRCGRHALHRDFYPTNFLYHPSALCNHVPR